MLVVVELGARRLAVPAARVRELAPAMPITPLPLGPPPVVGLTQLRGQVLPVLDLSEDGQAAAPEAPLLVLECGAARAALRVDRVLSAQHGADDAERLDVAALFDRIRSIVLVARE